MTRFITSIQLQNANEQDYEKLNSAMKEESKTLKSPLKLRERKKFYPGVEFELEGNMSLSAITDSAYRAARSNGKTYSFTVIKDKVNG